MRNIDISATKKLFCTHRCSKSKQKPFLKQNGHFHLEIFAERSLDKFKFKVFLNVIDKARKVTYLTIIIDMDTKLDTIGY